MFLEFSDVRCFAKGPAVYRKDYTVDKTLNQDDISVGNLSLSAR